jgi:putative glycerol-1-phosphate prenyltransferase
MKIYKKLLDTIQKRGAAFFVLLDPDKLPKNKIKDLVKKSEKAGADGFLIGSSLLLSTKFEDMVKETKKNTKLPVIIFPGNANQVSKYADAILFLSLVSGRNPHLLIGEQVKSAPMIKEYNLEAIPTGYIIVESGRPTSVQFMSDTQPIPSDKPDIVKAHALAAQYLGMKFVFLEAGSGAKNPVPDLIVKQVGKYIDIPIIVGGGIKTPQQAENKVKNGASVVIIGNVLEKGYDVGVLGDFARAIHYKGQLCRRK